MQVRSFRFLICVLFDTDSVRCDAAINSRFFASVPARAKSDLKHQNEFVQRVVGHWLEYNRDPAAIA